jgi:asparagine synthase (glutamine-hydrolysing)
VPAGCWLRVRGTTIEGPWPYWRPACPVEPEPLRSIESVAPPIEEVLRRAVNEQVVADAPIGCFLSGGLDSAVVTALASGTRPHTFTLGLADPQLDESAAAEAVAAHCGTRHRTIRLSDEEVARQVQDAVRASDLPSIDAINTALVARAAAGEGIRVVLSGLGADELFGGYPTFAALSRAERLASLLAATPRSPALEALTPLEAGLTRSQRYDQVRACRGNRELREAGLAADIGYGGSDPPERTSLASAVSLLELTGYMRSMLLRDGDGMSMAASVELRFPFLDHTLVDLCLSAQAARWTTAGTKPVLRQIARSLLPESMIGRPKQGFELPMAAWMRGPLRSFCEEGLARLHDHRAVPGALRERVWQEQAAPSREWRRLWQWVVLGQWLEAHAS